MGIYTEEKYLTIQPMELVTNEGLTIGLTAQSTLIG